MFMLPLYFWFFSGVFTTMLATVIPSQAPSLILPFTLWVFTLALIIFSRKGPYAAISFTAGSAAFILIRVVMA